MTKPPAAWAPMALIVLALAAGCGEDEPEEPAPEAARGDQPAFVHGARDVPSLEEAQARIEAALPDVPVTLPSPLPDGTSVASVTLYTEGRNPFAHLELDLGDAGQLLLQYGQAGFDGCPPTITRASVAGYDALVAEPAPPSTSSTVIWPVAERGGLSARGLYGIGGELPAEELLDLATSMSEAGVKPPKVAPSGC